MTLTRRPFLAPGNTWFWIADKIIAIAIAIRDRRDRRSL